MISMPDNPLLKTVPGNAFVEIEGDALFLGRDCHLVAFIPDLLNKVVSNRHCVVRREGPDRWMLEDLGSTNGTWIRDTRLNGKALLHTGDKFTLGKNGPTFECHRGFGGTGPDATVAESPGRSSAAAAAAAKTILDPELAAKTVVAPDNRSPAPKRPLRPSESDGTIDRPFKAGNTPSLKLRHERTGQEYAAAGYTITIGRDPESAQVVIRSEEEKHVSGRHAEIQFRSDGRVVVRDLSRNGTWVNNQKVKDETPLNVGDRLLLGAASTILLVKRLDLS